MLQVLEASSTYESKGKFEFRTLVESLFNKQLDPQISYLIQYSPATSSPLSL